MKQLFTFLVAVLFTTSAFSQAPEKMSYQAVVRDQNGNLKTNSTIGVQVTITNDVGIFPQTVYSETHTTTSNANGLITLEIGGGTVVSGNLSTINWGNGNYSIKTNYDLNGGTNYSLLGTTKLLSVPYALYAKAAGNTPATSCPNGTTIGEIKYWNGTEWIVVAPSLDGKVLTLEGGIPVWKDPQTTNTTLPVVTTNEISGIESTSAICGGDVSSSGGTSVTARGVCWSTTQNPTIATNKTTDGSGIGIFTSNITGLTANNTYYVRAYATNSSGTSYGEQRTLTITLPAVTTYPIKIIQITSAVCKGNVTNTATANVTERGVCWSLNQNPTTADNKIIYNDPVGAISCQITGLTANTTYYVRAYASNSIGTSYGDQAMFTTFIDACQGVTPPAGYGVVSSAGKCWLDRNLGASRVATSSTDTEGCGHLYQWGRGADGHQLRTSGTTTSLSSTNTPGHSNFIIKASSPYDWRSLQDDNLWQGVSGINNPCPTGYRLPTLAEWTAEMLTWDNTNGMRLYAAPLKLPNTGVRYSNDGLIYSSDDGGYYWLSTVDGTSAKYCNGGTIFSGNRAHAMSVRCIKN